VIFAPLLNLDTGEMGWKITIRTPTTLPAPNELDELIFTQMALAVEDYGIKKRKQR